MKLKYYLRGLGTGIVVTALVLGMSLSHGKENISDEEVKKRAEELGMVEEFKSLAEVSKEKDTKKTEDEGPKVSGNETVGDKASAENETVDDKASAENETVDDKASAENEEADNKATVGNKTADDKESNENPKEDTKTPADGQNTAKAEQEQEKPDDKPIKEEEASGQDTSENKQGSKSVLLEVYSGDGSLSVAKRAEKAGIVADAAEFDRFLCSGGYDKKICTGKHEIPEGATMEEIAKLLIRKP